jgi:hypothetical protein
MTVELVREQTAVWIDRDLQAVVLVSLLGLLLTLALLPLLGADAATVLMLAG